MSKTHGMLIVRSRDSLTERGFTMGREADVRFEVVYDGKGRYTGIIVRGLRSGREEYVSVPRGADPFLLELFDTAIEVSEDENGRPWRAPRTPSDAA